MPQPVTPMRARRSASRSPKAPKKSRSASKSPGRQGSKPKSQSRSPGRAAGKTASPAEESMVAADTDDSGKKVHFDKAEVTEYRTGDAVQQLRAARAMLKDALKRKSQSRELPQDKSEPGRAPRSPAPWRDDQPAPANRKSSKARRKEWQPKGRGRGGKGAKGKGKQSRGRQAGSTRSVQLQKV